MTRNHYEHEQQVALFRWRDLSLHTYPELKWMHSYPAAARRSPRQGAWMKAEGMRAGIWDIHVPWPVQKYTGCYIEMKSLGNKLTPEQEEFKKDNPQFWYAVCYDWIAARDAIILYLAGERF